MAKVKERLEEANWNSPLTDEEMKQIEQEVRDERETNKQKAMALVNDDQKKIIENIFDWDPKNSVRYWLMVDRVVERGQHNSLTFDSERWEQKEEAAHRRSGVRFIIKIEIIESVNLDYPVKIVDKQKYVLAPDWLIAENQLCDYLLFDSVKIEVLNRK